MTTVIKEKEFRFRMDERLVDQPPVINTFSVKGRARVNSRCPIGEMCELMDGDLIFNTAEGDYDTPLELNLTASDPEGDPISIEWFCASGSYMAPITDPLGGSARCTPGYFYPGAILIYAKVSDATNVVWSTSSGMKRELYMREFIH